jgi:UDP-N-acetylglucosamine 2-epimerase (non-hydrolysing)
MHILHVVGARPNFMKAAPVLAALHKRPNILQSLVHTGQHYDRNMSQVFFEQLAIPNPDVNLEVGSGTHSQQTAEVMRRLEPALLDRKPDLVLVYGDVNSTMAAAIVCSKLSIPLGHVEAGLRSFDRTMPEEINRRITDQLADLLFTPSDDGDRNLRNEGICGDKIFRVGNVMIDSLIRLLPLALKCESHRFPAPYVLVTLHRPSNVDDSVVLKRILQGLVAVSPELNLVLPVHPRTLQRLREFHLEARNLHLLEPLPYIEFLALQARAAAVVTDSGGVQEETTYLGVPCLTLRHNTERPITEVLGTNILIGDDMSRLRLELLKILGGDAKRGQIPPLWDGLASERIADVIANETHRFKTASVRCSN